MLPCPLTRSIAAVTPTDVGGDPWGMSRSVKHPLIHEEMVPAMEKKQANLPPPRPAACPPLPPAAAARRSPYPFIRRTPNGSYQQLDRTYY